MDKLVPQYVSRRAALGRMGAVLGGAMMTDVLAANEHAHAAPESPGDQALRAPAWYYQHFDADYALEPPEEGFGGWKQAEFDFARNHTAVVVMHAWAAGHNPEDYPGWWRCVPYIPRANAVLREVFPDLLTAVRGSGLPLFHVVGGGEYYKGLPGYKHAVEIAGPAPAAPERVPGDALRDKLDAFRNAHVFVGAHNAEDVNRGFAHLDFAPEARPQGDEGVAENAPQLLALCKERGINHLIYCGFAINWCLLLSPGGMADMSKHGILCSALRQATVAVENKDTAGRQLCKEIALWRVALAFGFVFDVDDFVSAIQRA